MIVLDTHVLSEILRPEPDGQVLAWLGAQPRFALFTTTVTQGELLYGVRLLPDGQRKTALLEAVLAIFASDFAAQVLSFDSGAAMPMPTSRRHAGRRVNLSANSMR